MPNKLNHSLLNVFEGPLYQIEKFSLIRLCGNVVYSVEKSYVDKLVGTEPSTPQFSERQNFFIDQNQFFFDVSYTVSQYLMT